jgi:hypothetical protein
MLLGVGIVSKRVGKNGITKIINIIVTAITEAEIRFVNKMREWSLNIYQSILVSNAVNPTLLFWSLITVMKVKKLRACQT